MGRKVRFADYEVDFTRHELRKGGVRVGLQHKPFRVLELLLRNPGDLITRQELVRYLWPDSHVSFEHGLNSAVNSLRQALGESSRESRFIETRPGLGYRFCAPVQEITEPKGNSGLSTAGEKSPDAFEDCLKGRYFLEKMEEEEVHKAIAYFNSALASDACSAPAHAGLAEAYCQLAVIGSVGPGQIAGRARSCADAALAADPDSPEAHVSDAHVRMVFEWDWAGSQNALARAFGLDGDFVPAYAVRAALLRISGRSDEALKVCREALALDPLSFPVNLQLAACFHAARDFKRSVDQCWKLLTLTPRFSPAQILLALAYEQLGMYDESIVEFQNAQRCAGFQAAIISGLVHVLTAGGRKREAEEALHELWKQSRNGYVSDYWQAVVCVGRRQFAQAASFLEDAASHRDTALLWAKADPRFDPMRDDPRFQNVLHAMGIPIAEPLKALDAGRSLAFQS